MSKFVKIQTHKWEFYPSNPCFKLLLSQNNGNRSIKKPTQHELNLSHINMVLSSLYPQDCKHPNGDTRIQLCCIMKASHQIPRQSIRFLFNRAMPIALPLLVKELSDPKEVPYVALYLKLVKLPKTGKLLPILIVRYFAWKDGAKCHIRVLDLKTVSRHSEEDAVRSILSVLDQVNLRSRIVSIEIDPKSSCFPTLRSKLSSILSNNSSNRRTDGLFHSPIEITTALVNVFDDIVRTLVPFRLSIVADMFKTDSTLRSFLGDFSEPSGELKSLIEAVEDTLNTPEANPLFPEHLKDSLLFCRQVLFRASVFFDFVRNNLNIPGINHFTSTYVNRIILIEIILLSGHFIAALYTAQREGSTYGDICMAIRKLRFAIQKMHRAVATDAITNLKYYYEDDSMPEEDGNRLCLYLDNMYKGAGAKVKKLESDFLDPFDWVLLWDRPETQQVLNSIEYLNLNQHVYGHSLRDHIDPAKVNQEIALLNALISPELLSGWHKVGNEDDPTGPHTRVPDRWCEVFQLDTKQELRLLPQLVQLIFTAVPSNTVNVKMMNIFEDAEHFWNCEVKLNGLQGVDWARLRTGLMMRHNFGQLTMQEIVISNFDSNNNIPLIEGFPKGSISEVNAEEEDESKEVHSKLKKSHRNSKKSRKSKGKSRN